MPNIIITNNANNVLFEFNDLSSKGYSMICFPKNIHDLFLSETEDKIEIGIGGKGIVISHTEVDTPSEPSTKDLFITISNWFND